MTRNPPIPTGSQLPPSHQSSTSQLQCRSSSVCAAVSEPRSSPVTPATSTPQRRTSPRLRSRQARKKACSGLCGSEVFGSGSLKNTISVEKSQPGHHLLVRRRPSKQAQKKPRKQRKEKLKKKTKKTKKAKKAKKPKRTLKLKRPHDHPDPKKRVRRLSSRSGTLTVILPPRHCRGLRWRSDPDADGYPQSDAPGADIILPLPPRVPRKTPSPKPTGPPDANPGSIPHAEHPNLFSTTTSSGRRLPPGASAPSPLRPVADAVPVAVTPTAPSTPTAVVSGSCTRSTASSSSSRIVQSKSKSMPKPKPKPEPKPDAKAEGKPKAETKVKLVRPDREAKGKVKLKPMAVPTSTTPSTPSQRKKQVTTASVGGNGKSGSSGDDPRKKKDCAVAVAATATAVATRKRSGSGSSTKAKSKSKVRRRKAPIPRFRGRRRISRSKTPAAIRHSIHVRRKRSSRGYAIPIPVSTSSSSGSSGASTTRGQRKQQLQKKKQRQVQHQHQRKRARSVVVVQPRRCTSPTNANAHTNTSIRTDLTSSAVLEGVVTAASKPVSPVMQIISESILGAPFVKDIEVVKYLLASISIRHKEDHDHDHDKKKIVFDASTPLPGVPRPVPPDFDGLRATSLQAKLHAVQEFISSFEYNYIRDHYFFDINKHRPLSSILETADEIIRDSLPIRCLEGAFLAIHQTQSFGCVDRFPVFFVTWCSGVIYRHVLIVVRYMGFFGALGMSRQHTLMSRELKYRRLSDILLSFVRSYEAILHVVVFVSVGLPVQHRVRSSSRVIWEFLRFDLSDSALRNIRQLQAATKGAVVPSRRFERRSVRRLWEERVALRLDQFVKDVKLILHEIALGKGLSPGIIKKYGNAIYERRTIRKKIANVTAATTTTRSNNSTPVGASAGVACVTPTPVKPPSASQQSTTTDK